MAAAAPFGRDALEDAFRRAADSSGGVVERTFDIAGAPVRFRFAGPALAFLTEAFDHLAGESSDPPVLTVDFWDAASTSVPVPEPPREGRVGEAAGLRVLWQRDPLRVVMQPGQRTLNAIDIGTDGGPAHGWFWCADPAALPFWEPSAPIRMIMHWWLGTRGMLLVHAAAMGFDAGGVLVVGVGGSGKSTTSLLALRHGMRFASDDYVAVDPHAGASGWPSVHSLYGSAKVTGPQLKRFPELMPGVVNADRLDTEKAVLYVGRVAAKSLTRGFPLRAVLVPRISGRAATSVRRISPVAALTGLAPSTIFQLPGTATTDLAAMAQVVRHVPTFLIELGTDLPGVPVTIADLLRELEVTP